MNEAQLIESFRPISVAELLNGEYIFHYDIPSFQRGYRWERKQVEDLLNDIFTFSKNSQASYFLQPLVIKQDGEKWEVLDGQQRLTTMLLILMKVISRLSDDDKEEYQSSLYDITYKIRPELDFNNPDPKKTIDGFYLAEAKATIDRWFDSKKKAHVSLSKFNDCLLDSSSEKQVKFIWYSLSSNSSELNSINVFNRLNKGKIGLTSAELIKALFVLDFDINEKKTRGSVKDTAKEEGEGTIKRTEKSDTASSQLVMKWNEIERKFQDDKFWLFISNDIKNIQTRIDLLFDFLTEKPEGEDSDFSYRRFQNLFDSCHSENVILQDFWVKKGITSMEKAWREIKKTYDRLLAWYEDNMYFHYVGFLISQKCSPLWINNSLQAAKDKRKNEKEAAEWTRFDSEAHLKSLITGQFKTSGKVLTRSDIDKLEYSDQTIVRRLLLLFNIELCIKTGNQRFKFDKFKTEHWDIEHVDSQNNSCLQKPEDRISWLRDIVKILSIEKSETEAGIKLFERCSSLLAGFDKQPEGERVFSDDVYFALYKYVNQYFSFDPAAGDVSIESVDLASKDKDNINNLTLLNSDINRSYKDAPFPFKRDYILNEDKKGSHFIPIGTRNLFMKYYTNEQSSASALQLLRWNENDKKSYLKFLHSIVDEYFA